MSNFMPMLYAFWDSDITYSFRKSRVAVISALVLLAIFLTAIFAPSLAPQDPFNIAELDLFDSELPPLGSRAVAPPTCSALTLRPATCCPRSCTGCGFLCWSVSPA